MLGEIFFRSLKDKNVEINADDGGWLLKFQKELKTVPDNFRGKSWFWLAGAKDLAVINKKQDTRTTLFY